MRLIKQSTSIDVVIGPFLDETDGKTAETALTITQPDIRLKKNGGAWAQKNAAQTLSHEENGNYEVTLDATDTDTLGQLRVHVHESGALPVWEDFMVMPANVWDSLFGADKLEVDVAQFGGTNLTASGGRPEVNASHAAGTAWNSGAIGASTLASDTITAAKIASDAITAAKIANDAITAAKIATGAIDADAIADGAIDAGAIADGAIDAATFAAGAIDAAAIAADAIGSSELAASAVAEIQSGLSTLTAGQAADAVWDEAAADHVASGSFGQRNAILRANTAQAGANGSITLDVSASATDDFYKNALIVITAGTGSGQARTISGYTGSSKVATVTPNWGTNPASDSVFVIIPTGAIAGATAPTAGEVADAVWDEARSGHVSAGSFGEYTPANVSHFGGSAGTFASGRPEVNTSHIGGSAISQSSGVANVNVAQISGDSAAADNLEAAADGTGFNLGGGSVVAASVTGAVGSVTGNVGGNVTGTVGGFTAGAKAEIQTEAEDALVAHRLDELLNADSDIDGAAPPTIGSVVHEIMSKTAGSFTYDQTTDSLEAVRDRGDAAWADSGTPPTAAAIASQVRTELTTELGRIDAAVSSRLSSSSNGSGFTAIPWNASWDAEVQSEMQDALDTMLADSVPADGTRPTLAQAVYMITQFLLERSVSGTTVTVKKADGSTTLMTFTINDASTPTSITRAS